MGRRALGPNMRFSVRLRDIKLPSSDVRDHSGDGKGFPCSPLHRAPPALSGWGPPTPVLPKAPLPPVPWHRGATLAIAPSGRVREVCGAAVTSHQHPGPGAVTRLRSFAAEPVKESAIHSTGWAEPGLAWAPPGMGTSQGWGGEKKWGLGFVCVCLFSLLKHVRESEVPAWCVGKVIFQITPQGAAESTAPQIS